MNIDANRAATIASLEAEARDNAATMQEQHAEITRLRAELEALRSVAGEDFVTLAANALCEAMRDRRFLIPVDLAEQAARAVLAAVVPAIRAEGWQSIETAPRDADVLLGWWQNWPDRHWKMEAGWAGASNTKPPGMSNAWLHGQATHWQPLPEPPTAVIRAGGNDAN